MKERLAALRPVLVRAVGYPAFFMFWFVVFIYWTFPYDRLKETIVAAVEAPRTARPGTPAGPNMQLAIGSLGPTFLPGIAARDVAFTFLPTQSGDHPITMQMRRVTAHVGLFALMASNVIADIAVDGVGGTITAHIEQALSGTSPGLRELRMTIDHVRASDLAPLVAAVGLPVSGLVDGNVDLHLPEGHAEQATGTIHLNVADLRIGDGHAQFQTHFGGLTIEQIRAGRFESTVNVHEGVATIERFGSHSPEFQFSMEGGVRLRPVFGQSAVDTTVRFQLTDAYRHKSDVSERIVSALSMIPDLQRARRPDGMLTFHCTGPVDRMQCPPDSRAASPVRTIPGARRPFAPSPER